MSYLAKIHQAIKKHPNKIALTSYSGLTEVNSLSYQNLELELQKTRKVLIKKKLRAGEKVPVIAAPIPGSIITLLACFSLDLMAVPIDPVLSQQQTNDLLSEIPFVNNKDPACLLLHSSGSTGEPKKIIYSCEKLMAFMSAHDYLYRQYSDEEGKAVYQSDMICALPIHHLGGLALCLQGLMMGRSVHLMQSFESEEYLQLAVDKRLRLLILVPSMLETCIEYAALYKNTSFKFAIVFGESSSAKILESIAKAFAVKIFSPCGLTECQTGIGFSQEDIENSDFPIECCGQQLFGESKLMNEDGLTENSVKGELWVKNDTTRACYVDEAQNKRSYIDGWFKTGDIFRKDELGRFFHCGRKDNMFVVNGKKIYPKEIENIFIKHPSIKDAHSFPLLSACGKTFPGVLIELIQNEGLVPPTRNDLIDYYLQIGQMQVAPGWILIKNNPPRKAIGKIDRIKCEALLQHDYEDNYLNIAS